MIDHADVASFTASMPPTYAASFDVEAIAGHAAIVARRAGVFHAEAWNEPDGGVHPVLVVADDRPGLLARMCAALTANDVDVVGAHAYCRTRADLGPEAVDFLWIRRAPPAGAAATRDTKPLGGDELRALFEKMASLVQNDGSIRPGPLQRSLASGGSTRVRFETDERGMVVLTVEAVDRPGLLLAITQALFGARLQIVGLRATSEGGRAVDRFSVTELDGRALQNARLLELQNAIFEAIEPGQAA